MAAVIGAVETATTARAATITWGAPQNISGDSDVSTVGTLLYAYNFGHSRVDSTTVNGVEFTAFALPNSTPAGIPVTLGSVSIAESPGELHGYHAFGSFIPPFSALSFEYQTLLWRGATGGQTGTLTLELGGLTPGQAYDFQWWSNNSTDADNWSQTIASAGNSVALITNTSGTGSQGTGVDGGVGQYAIGRFTTRDAVDQSVECPVD